MSVSVAAGTLLVPLLAGVLEPTLGTDAVLLLGALGLPAVGLTAVWTLARDETSRPDRATPTESASPEPRA